MSTYSDLKPSNISSDGSPFHVAITTRIMAKRLSKLTGSSGSSSRSSSRSNSISSRNSIQQNFQLQASLVGTQLPNSTRRASLLMENKSSTAPPKSNKSPTRSPISTPLDSGSIINNTSPESQMLLFVQQFPKKTMSIEDQQPEPKNESSTMNRIRRASNVSSRESRTRDRRQSQLASLATIQESPSKKRSSSLTPSEREIFLTKRKSTLEDVKKAIQNSSGTCSLFDVDGMERDNNVETDVSADSLTALMNEFLQTKEKKLRDNQTQTSVDFEDVKLTMLEEKRLLLLQERQKRQSEEIRVVYYDSN